MTNIDQTTGSAAPKSAASAVPKSEGNPAFRMMGLPRIRPKLPSRNWLIFLSITGSFTAAVIYDRYHKRKVQQKWCNAVSHLADEPLPTTQLPRKITVFLEAPPGDFLLPAREYFQEYVKPILVASALQWDVVEGRKEGDIRHKLAERIRHQRRKAGESPGEIPDEASELENIIVGLRAQTGVNDSKERGGDLVIGRHTYKEYIRGLHEGWLGPLNAPSELQTTTHGGATLEMPVGQRMQDGSDLSKERPGELSDLATNIVKHSSAVQSLSSETGGSDLSGVNLIPESAREDVSVESKENAGDSASLSESSKQKDTEDTKPKLENKTPYIRPVAYPSAQLAASTPEVFPPTVAVQQPHILGFLNTPIRIWRFLNRRQVADSAGAAVVAFILAPDTDVRPYRTADASSHSFEESTSSPDSTTQPSRPPEWQTILEHEERDWHKSARKPNPEGQEGLERPWQEPMVVDPRIEQRMRTIDVQAFVKRIASIPEVGATSPSDLAATAVAKAAGSILAGSSGATGTEDVELSNSSPKGVGWKGAVDRAEKVSWGEWFRNVVGMGTDRTTKPWLQGLQGDEES